MEPDHTSLRVDDGENGVWIPPVPSSYIVSELQTFMRAAGTNPVQIPGYWQPTSSSTSPSPNRKVILNLHGGGYTSGSAHHSSEMFSIVKAILAGTSSLAAFCVEYRLSKGPPFVTASENGFPAPLLDALSAYAYLLEQGYNAKNIIVEGDSAGGNLAMALTRYLVSHFPEITPGGLLLLSPWSDVSYPIARNATRNSWGMHADFDPETDGLMRYSQLAISGVFGVGGAAHNVYLSPASPELPAVSFAGFPSTFISSGTSEGYNYQQNRELRDRMVRDLGDKVEYFEGKDMVHDFVMFEWCEPERGKTLKAIAAWIDNL